MGSFARNWRKVPKVVRQPLILIAGTTLIIIGLALLVLPGPGWVAIFLGFAILATEFAFAEKIRDRLVRIVKLLIEKFRRLFRKH